MTKIFKEIHPVGKLAITGLLSIFCSSLFYGIALLLSFIFFEVTPEEVGAILKSEHKNIGLMKFMQAFFSVGFFLLPALVAAYLFGNNIFSFLQIKRFSEKSIPAMAAIAMIIGLPLINFMAQVNEQILDFILSENNGLKLMENNLLQLTKELLTADNVLILTINVIVIAVIPALGEEILFRGLVQRFFADWTKNIHLGIIISALIFSTFHMQFYSFIPRFAMGIFFGYLLVWSGNIWVPIIAHFVNNAFAVIFTGLYGYNSDLEDIGTNNGDALTVFLSALFVILLLVVIYRHSHEIKND